ncbi:MAG: CPBP family intramembrane metalloprotease [Gemmatimonadota bacterium]|nr:CPBP family intramembrane metalloprotease [Gemmatimonadota bacterium]
MESSAVARQLDRVQLAAVALGMFALALALRSLLFRLDAFRAFYEAHPSQIGEAVWKTGWVIVACSGVMLAHGVGARAALRELGLGGAETGRGLLYAFAATLPALIAFALAFPVTHTSDPWQLGMTALISPLSEEVLFRGYIFRQLYARAGWPFWAALLVNVIPFAWGHLGQADRAGGGLLTVVGVLAVTGLGAGLFAWLFVRSGYSLWFVIGLHALLNLYWYVFTVSNTAIGGWLSNLARMATLGLAIWLSSVLAHRRSAQGTILSDAPAA